jgi:homoserine dehydrogenase
LGNVGRALVRLLQSKRRELAERGIDWRITGITSRRLGWIACATGLDPRDLLDEKKLAGLRPTATTVEEWLEQAQVEVLFEASSLNRRSGEPAISHIRAALERGAHAISANKGPVVFAYDELQALARSKNKSFLFESAVMDGVPIFSLFRETLPAARVLGFRGILNATTNVVLAGMESGLDLKRAVAKAQEMGIAESDPTDDLEGWDAAVKAAALVIVVLGHPIKLEEIERRGITELSATQVQAARREGKPFKLVCRARRDGEKVVASVRPEQLPLSDPLASIDGGSSYVEFELDVVPGLGIMERDGNLETTAYGMLADFIRAVSSGEK